jgi:hypothetical protein
MKTNIGLNFRKLISGEKFKTQQNKRKFKRRLNPKRGSSDTLGQHWRKQEGLLSIDPSLLF